MKMRGEWRKDRGSNLWIVSIQMETYLKWTVVRHFNQQT